MALIQNTYTLPDKLANFEQISSITLSGSATANNGVFSSSYDIYMTTFDAVGSSASNNQFKFKYYNETGATSDNTYRGVMLARSSDNSDKNQHFSGAYPQFTTNQSGTSGEGFQGVMWTFNPLTESVQTNFSGYGSFHRSADSEAAGSFFGGVATDYGSREHTGFYWFLDGGGNFNGRCKVVTYGVKRT
tara:strand:- start:205 stop:771 length:567 start_codon:yes stop_codon:yes gene_type:complete